MSEATNTVTRPREDELVEGTSLLKDAMRRFWRNKMSMVCVTLTAFIVLLCFMPQPSYNDLEEAFRSADTNKDGRLSDKERGASSAIATTLGALSDSGITADSNGDGRLTFVELRAATRKQQQAKFEAFLATMKVAFRRFDKDADSKLSAAEIARAPRFSKAVAALDPDRDGRITRREVALALERARAAAPEDAEKRAARLAELDALKAQIDEGFAAADSDNDGALDAGELKKAEALAKALGPLKADGDGAVSLEELKASVGRVRAKTYKAQAEALSKDWLAAFDRADKDKDKLLTAEEAGRELELEYAFKAAKKDDQGRASRAAIEEAAELRAAELRQEDEALDQRIAALSSELMDRFKAADTKRDRRLDAGELAAAKELGGLLKALGADADGDGDVTVAEASAALKKAKDARYQTFLAELPEDFRRVDSDGDGALTPAEITAEAEASKLVEPLSVGADGVTTMERIATSNTPSERWTPAYRYQQQELKNQSPRFSLSSIHYWFGTDALGRSLFWRVLYGGRISFVVAFVGTIVSLVIGVLFGSVAGYAGGRLDNLMMRFVDVLYGLPFMFLVILIMTLIKTAALWPIFVALGLVQWLTMARIARGQVISLREQEFITAARTVGASTPRIIMFHIIPNLLGPIIIYTTLTIPGVMLQESFLSFLGLGIREPECSWGSLAADGIQSLSPIASYWWQSFFPCLALALTLFSLNFIGDGLRDALDPKGRK